MEDTVKILIVDDSRVFRNILERIISEVPGVKVIGSVESGRKALDFLRLNVVDLMTLDVEMPDMDGLVTLKEMLAQKNRLKSAPEVLMVSSLTRTGSDITLKALECGAFDFIAKPSPEISNSQESLKIMLQSTIKAWITRKNRRFPSSTTTSSIRTLGQNVKIDNKPTFTHSLTNSIHTKPVMAILIGVSTGGPKSLAEVLPKLCSMTNLPILLVQHMPPNFTKSLADSLTTKCSHKVIEGLPGTIVEDKTVYIAPGGYHMTVKPKGALFVLENNQDAPENGCRPSVDVLFRSAAQAYPPDSLIGVILTGMGNDGTPSLQMLRNKNAYLIAQNEETSVVFGMPRAAAATGLLNKVAPLMRIPEAIVERINMSKKMG